MAKCKSKQHNPLTCFRCRLFLLSRELHPKGVTDAEGRLALLAMAEVCGIILAQLPEQDKAMFMYHLIKNEHQTRDAIEQEAEATRH